MKTLLALLVYSMLQAPFASAAMPFAKPVILSAEQGRYRLGTHLEVLEDREGIVTFEQILSGTYDTRFLPCQNDISNFGFTKSIYWVRVQIRNTNTHQSLWFLEIGSPFTDRIDLFIIHADGKVERKKAGDSLPFQQREIEHRHFVFPLDIAEHASQDIYLRYRNKGRITIDLSLWGSQAFAISQYQQQIASGLFYGAVLIMLGYNALLFFLLKERIYLHYVLFVSSLSLLLLSNEGFAYQYLWPGMPVWNDVALRLFTGISGIIALNFSSHFLRIKRYSILLHRIIGFAISCWVILLVAFILTRHSALPGLITGMNIPIPLILIWAGAIAWQKGYRPARYYLLSWGVLFSGVFFEVLGIFGVIPISWIGGRGIRFGLVLALTLLSLALAERINSLKLEKDLARESALKTSLENERLVREQNILLEKKVAERTSDLQHSNKQLQQEISERHRAENILRKLEKAIETTEVGITISDNVGCITYINPADANMHGYRVEELLGKPSKMFAASEELQSDESESSGTSIWKRERLNQRKNGSVFPVELISTPLYDETGMQIGRVTVCEDITEHKRAEREILDAHEALQEKNRQLEEVNAGKDKFFSIISHDLRSPLNVILGLTEMLSDAVERNDCVKVRRYLQNLEKSTSRLYVLLENLLTWARLQRGALEYMPRSIRLLQLAEENLDLCSSRAEQKQVELHSEIPADLSIHADYAMIDTVLRNLLSNALKFTQAGDGVQVSARRQGAYVEIRVSDSGSGIAADVLPDLFRIDVHYSISGTDGERGTGLGLILCQELIERNGGKIWVESELGTGSTFHFLLPVGEETS